MKPIIGITPAYDLEKGYGYIKRGYYESVQRAGGVPVILPERASGEAAEDLIKLCDGFIFTGGQDFGAEFYGEEIHPKTGKSSPLRDEFEFGLAERILREDKAVLGICRGAQLITLLLGGRLWQDIPSQVEGAFDHDLPPYDKNAHDIIIEENSPLFTVTGRGRIAVNSCHHQAVRSCGAGEEVMAYSYDGIIEAVYMPEKRFVWGVQWHPELMSATDGNAFKIFESFIASSGEGRFCARKPSKC